MSSCPYCKKLINAQSTSCHFCGKSVQFIHKEPSKSPSFLATFYTDIVTSLASIGGYIENRETIFNLTTIGGLAIAFIIWMIGYPNDALWETCNFIASALFMLSLISVGALWCLRLYRMEEEQREVVAKTCFFSACCCFPFFLVALVIPFLVGGKKTR